MVSGRRRSVIFFTVFGICLVAIAVALNVGWVVINWRRGVLALLGLFFFLALIAGLVVNVIFLVREIRRFRPEAIICGDPTVVWAGDNYINHPDHRATATAAVDAIFPAAAQPNLFEEIEKEDGFLAHKPRKVMVSTWGEPADVFVNITDSIDQKIASLREHKSQMKGWDPEPMVREWAAMRAKGKRVYGIGHPMGIAASDTFYSFLTFANAYNAKVVDENGKIVLDQPENKKAMVEAVKSYANIFQRGCTPPSSGRP